MSYLPTSLTISLFLLIGAFFSPTNVQAQSKSSSPKIVKLREGTLVVVLQTHEKKQMLLREISEDESKSDAERKRAKKMLEASIEERSQFNRALASAFSKSYDFGNYLIIKDVDYHEFSKGGSVKFYDEQLNPKKGIKFDQTKPVFYIKEGYADGSASYSFNIVDEHSQSTSAHFPSSIRVSSSIFDDIAHIFSKKQMFDFTKRIKKLDKKLLKTYSSQTS